MAGLINKAMGGGAPAPAGSKLDLSVITKGIQVPPELKDAFDRVVEAGKRVLYDKETHDLVLEQMSQEGPMPQKLGDGIANLMLMLFAQSNKTMPPAVIVPAGLTLMADAADFLSESGEAVSQEDLGEAIALMIQSLLSKFGLDPERVMSAAQGGGGQPAAPAPAAPAAPAPQEA